MSETAQAPIGAAPAPYTVVLTSCGRFDLLRETVSSFLEYVDIKPAAFVVIEDSGDEAVRDALAGLDFEFEILLNRPQLGQMGAIDRAYAAVATPFVFHCEDDWDFFRTGFIAESFEVLVARPQVSMVGLRPRAELNPRVREMPVERAGTVEFFELDPSLHPEYFSYSFNPGLRRLIDFERFAPVEALGKEEDVSYAFKKAGFRMANLEAPAVRHLGDGRHVDDPTSRKKATTFGARLSRSVRKRWKRLSRLVRGN